LERKNPGTFKNRKRGKRDLLQKLGLNQVKKGGSNRNLNLETEPKNGGRREGAWSNKGKKSRVGILLELKDSILLGGSTLGERKN